MGLTFITATGTDIGKTYITCLLIKTAAKMGISVRGVKPVISGFDENKIKLSKILEIFFKTHNPTELNKQGNDIGTQYRSAIFYTNEKQKIIARAIISLIYQGFIKN